MSDQSVIATVDSTGRREDAPTAVTTSANSDSAQIMGMIARIAADKSIDVERMLKVLEIREKELARIAEQQFIAAMAEFKANPPKILKDKLVSIPHKQGPGKTEYKHATLGGIVAAVIDGLSKVGISHRWDLDQLDGGIIRVTNVLTHRGGFSIRTALQNSADDSGSKNNLQAKASTITYLQRYTLMSALGLAAEDEDDDDGQGGGKPKINESQLADLMALIEEVGANKVRLLNWLGIEDFADLRADLYVDTCKVIRENAKKKGGGK